MGCVWCGVMCSVGWSGVWCGVVRVVCVWVYGRMCVCVCVCLEGYNDNLSLSTHL